MFIMVQLVQYTNIHPSSVHIYPVQGWRGYVWGITTPGLHVWPWVMGQSYQWGNSHTLLVTLLWRLAVENADKAMHLIAEAHVLMRVKNGAWGFFVHWCFQNTNIKCVPKNYDKFYERHTERARLLTVSIFSYNTVFLIYITICSTDACKIIWLTWIIYLIVYLSGTLLYQIIALS